MEICRARTALGFACLTLPAVGQEKQIFKDPIRLRADGKIIDHGAAGGHCGPWIEDVNGDGNRDLVVGDFGGKFTVYLNVGTEKEPLYGRGAFLKAGGQDAKVPIYCCIGASPQFADYDGDGKLDLISGSYDPGEIYLFRGEGGGKFRMRETLVDSAGKSVLTDPNQKATYESFGSWVAMVDWEGDGDLDLIIGNYAGNMLLRRNTGTRTKPVWSVENERIQAEGKDIQVPDGHATPVVVDWDGDGRWDLLSGCEKGSVLFYRNVGTRTEPKFAAARTIVPPHVGDGDEEFLDLGAEPKPGVRSQVAVADWDGDGKLDLLVGDFQTTVSPRADLSKEERADMQELLDERTRLSIRLDELSAQVRAELSAWRKASMSEDEHVTDAGQERMSKRLAEIEAEKGVTVLSERDARVRTDLRQYLQRSKSGQREQDEYSTTHGFVWLYLRK